MALNLVTAPAVEPITVAEAKAHLRVEVPDEDDLIATLIEAARGLVEVFTHRALITQTWELQLDGFPWGGELDDTGVESGALMIPKPPLQTITSITYVDTDGVTQTWTASLYTVDAPAGPWARMGRVVPAYFEIYPTTRAVPKAVIVKFVAGYGTTAVSVPGAIRSAMKLLIGNWYANREAGQIARAQAGVLPFGVDSLLWAYKAF